MKFSDLNLSKPLLNALNEMGLEQPTPIQEKAFSVIMSGKDVVGTAQTGTGKTLAFLLPTLRMWSFQKHRHAQVLILVPTRELAVQIVEEIEKLTPYMNVVAVGGLWWCEFEGTLRGGSARFGYIGRHTRKDL
jgi:ATP-dependent RNA helicase RhlE